MLSISRLVNRKRDRRTPAAAAARSDDEEEEGEESAPETATLLAAQDRFFFVVEGDGAVARGVCVTQQQGGTGRSGPHASY